MLVPMTYDTVVGGIESFGEILIESSRTPSHFTIVFLILWLIMSDRESETSDTTDPGSSLGNPSSFDSESDWNSLNSSDERMDVSSSIEELVVGAASAGGAQRAASQPGAARGRARQRGGRGVHRGPCTERVARCSCATTWRSMGRTLLLRVQLSKVRLFVRFRVHVHFERKITQTRRKFGYQRTFCVCKIFSQNACKGEHLRVEMTYTQCMITFQNNAVPEACDCAKKWVTIGLMNVILNWFQVQNCLMCKVLYVLWDNFMLNTFTLKLCQYVSK